MIKFFRRIRQKLIVKGNLKRYLIYAIGEILLVVIGILIALQINNWNQQRKNNQMEEHFIRMILSDVDGSIEDLEHTIAGATRQIQAGKILLSELGLSKKNEKIDSSFLLNPRWEFLSDLSKSIFFLSVTRSFESSRSGYDELIASGKIAIIRDFDLRSKITLFYKELEDREVNNQVFRGFEDRYIHALQLAGIAVTEESPDSLIKRKLLDSPVCIAAIRNQLSSAQRQINECSGIVEYIISFKNDIMSIYSGISQVNPKSK